jgi:hypothetical protein
MKSHCWQNDLGLFCVLFDSATKSPVFLSQDCEQTETHKCCEVSVYSLNMCWFIYFLVTMLYNFDNDGNFSLLLEAI